MYGHDCWCSVHLWSSPGREHMFDAIRLVVRWAVADAALRSTAGSAAVILAVRSAPSVRPASSWSLSVQSMQTESVRLALCCLFGGTENQNKELKDAIVSLTYNNALLFKWPLSYINKSFINHYRTETNALKYPICVEINRSVSTHQVTVKYQSPSTCWWLIWRGTAKHWRKLSTNMYVFSAVVSPGGFRCHGMTEREANSGMCGHSYFFNSDMDECQACNECDGEPVTTPCTFVTDAMCSGPAVSDSALSMSWNGEVSLQGPKGHILAHASHGVQLHIQGRGDAGLVSTEDGRLVLRQHGLVWLDENLSVSHGCRSFIQVCLRLNNTDGSESKDLSGIRLEQRDTRSLQSVSISGVAEVAPGHIISLFLRSASQHCNESREGLQLYDQSAAPLSLLWLSHDTGAVAMTAQAVVSAHYHTSYRPVFRTSSTSDAYVVGLTHDGRGIRFTEGGTVRFVFQQALYSMGQACVSEGFQLLAYLSLNGTGTELCRSFKPGVHYRDTSISMSGAAIVGPRGHTGLWDPLSCSVQRSFLWRRDGHQHPQFGLGPCGHFLLSVCLCGSNRPSLRELSETSRCSSVRPVLRCPRWGCWGRVPRNRNEILSSGRAAQPA